MEVELYGDKDWSCLGSAGTERYHWPGLVDGGGLILLFRAAGFVPCQLVVPSSGDGLFQGMHVRPAWCSARIFRIRGEDWDRSIGFCTHETSNAVWMLKASR